MQELLKDKYIIINNKKYYIKVPKIFCFESGILHMQYCEGDNLEFYLRNKETYEKGKNIINTLLKYIIENKIYWYGFAARNILVGKNTIYFVDFEKGIGNMDTDIQSFLQHNVYEEYLYFY